MNSMCIVTSVRVVPWQSLYYDMASSSLLLLLRRCYDFFVVVMTWFQNSPIDGGFTYRNQSLPHFVLPVCLFVTFCERHALHASRDRWTGPRSGQVQTATGKYELHKLRACKRIVEPDNKMYPDSTQAIFSSAALKGYRTKIGYYSQAHSIDRTRVKLIVVTSDVYDRWFTYIIPSDVHNMKRLCPHSYLHVLHITCFKINCCDIVCLRWFIFCSSNNHHVEHFLGQRYHSMCTTWTIMYYTPYTL